MTNGPTWKPTKTNNYSHMHNYYTYQCLLGVQSELAERGLPLDNDSIRAQCAANIAAMRGLSFSERNQEVQSWIGGYRSLSAALL